MKLEINNRTKSKIDLAVVKKIASAFSRKYKLGDQELSLAFIGDAAMKKLNRKYRGQDSRTDILSFRGEADFFGELIIDYAQIKRQAKQFGQTAEHELAFILVHGLLHLIGYDDKTERERKKMIKIGEEFIKRHCERLEGAKQSHE
ncbi:MAG: rRNA maturation RNase YbeY [bacterium]|nr:rRNA maturation RNase YbeY [bacterium]